MLKLKATTADDIAVISACLQDTAVQADDIVWEPAHNRFAFIGQRFMWEEQRKTGEQRRTNVRVWVDGVAAAQRKAKDDAAPALQLLAATLKDTTLTLHFAEGAAARLQLSTGWCTYIEDFGPTWPADKCPSHAV